MKCSISILLLMLLVAIAPGKQLFAQDKKAQNSKAFAKLCAAINKKDDAGMYALTNTDFQKNIDWMNFQNYSRFGIFVHGAITDTLLTSYANGTSTYKATFSDGVFNIKLSTDDDGKISALLFKKADVVSDVKKPAVSFSNPLATKLDKAIDEAAQEYMQKPGTTGLCIGLLQNGIMRSYSYGETEKGSGEMPGVHSAFEIGSVTKTFTATLLAWYVTLGRLSLDEPITKYLPDSVKKNPKLKGITLKMLSNHTSGLARIPDNLMQDNADMLNPYKKYNRKKLFAYLKRCKPETAPGTVSAYSNLGVGLLGTILEKVTGKTYEEMIEEVIAKPLKLEATGIGQQHGEHAHAVHLLPVYNEKGETTPRWDFDALAGCGALRSTSIDLLTYAQANLDLNTSLMGRALALTHEITYEKAPMFIGLGWMLKKTDKGPVYWHNGGTFGSSSFIAFFPGKGTAMVVLSNCVQSVDEMSSKIIAALQE